MVWMKEELDKRRGYIVSIIVGIAIASIVIYGFFSYDESSDFDFYSFLTSTYTGLLGITLTYLILGLLLGLRWPTNNSFWLGFQISLPLFLFFVLTSWGTDFPEKIPPVVVIFNPFLSIVGTYIGTKINNILPK